MLSNTQSIQLQLYADQGDTFFAPVILKNILGATLNITGYTVSFELKPYYGVADNACVTTVEIIDAVIGSITLNISATETSKLVSTRYVYQVVVTNGTEIVKVLHGTIFLSIF